MKTILLFTTLILGSIPSGAIELSLEENRAERGSVGYVDMQRLFSNSPDSQRAKETFEELVRQAEERVNLRKAELLRLRQELDARRSERETLAMSTITTPAVVGSTIATVSAGANSVPVSSRVMTLPGMSDNKAAPLEAPQGSTSTQQANVEVSSTIPPSTPVVPEGPTLGQRLLELDGKIIGLQADISRKEVELTREREEADHGLLDVENRKTDQVLARLYRALTEVARREGVSVVVDKTTILYGHKAVDLTDKVLKYLREAPQR
jgi:Skp family chaperone for outer membrane proteins